MRKAKRIMVLVMEIVGLFILLQTLAHGGMAALLGPAFGQTSKVIIEFGIIVMTLFSSLLSFYLDKRRFRILRDTEVHLIKYMTILGMFEVLANLISKTTEAFAVGITGLHPIVMSVMVMSYCMTAFMMPFNYIKGLFATIKSDELSNSRSLIKRFFD